MYPTPELKRLAVAKAGLRRTIARRRLECVQSAGPVAQPRRAPRWRLIPALLLAFAVCDWAWNGGQFMPRPKPAYDISY